VYLRSKKHVVLNEGIKLITFTADAKDAERESFLICPEKYSGQIKRSQPFRHFDGRRPGSSGESVSHRFSRKNTLSQRPLCLERVPPLAGRAGGELIRILFLALGNKGDLYDLPLSIRS
jgi:hypothetical protein